MEGCNSSFLLHRQKLMGGRRVVCLVSVPFHGWKKGSSMSHFVRAGFQGSRPKKTLPGHSGSNQIVHSHLLRKFGDYGGLTAFTLFIWEP